MQRTVSDAGAVIATEPDGDSPYCVTCYNFCTMNDLDRPVWASLTHAPHLAEGCSLAMRFRGFTEVSGVCTHPDFRGRGLARRLSTIVAHAIQRRGEQPFLHAWTTNQAAISLYENLGFEFRAAVQVAVLERVA